MLSAPFIPLPVNNLIHNKGLFRAAPSQIDTGGFDAGVAQKVGQESDVSAIFNEIFSETMPERMGIYYFWVKVIPVCKCF